jgi:acetyl-CoA/propionyl-CoA carboxylase biotin carboxyl carrier protein
MIAKVIVWDRDRESATRRMLRALHEYEIEGLKTLLPFHKALLKTRQWADGETCRDLVTDRAWLKALAPLRP